MPTVYTPDEGNNPATISLPADLEPKTAESVNAALRALADKIAYTQDTTPLLAAFNAFTRGQRITPPDDEEAMITSDRIPDDENRWVPIISVPLETNRHLRMFAGGFSGAGRFALTVNAQWDVELQEWSRDDNSGEASALIAATDYVSFHSIGSGTDPWSTWPTASGNTGNVRCSGEFQYISSKTRQRTIPVSSATGAVTFSGADGSAGAAVIGDHSYIRWWLRLAPGVVLSKVSVLHHIATSATETFRVTRRRSTWDPFDVQTPAEEELVEVDSDSATGDHITVLNVSGTTVDKYDELCLLWEPSGILLNNVHAISVEFADPGPRML